MIRFRFSILLRFLKEFILVEQLFCYFRTLSGCGALVHSQDVQCMQSLLWRMFVEQDKQKQIKQRRCGVI